MKFRQLALVSVFSSLMLGSASCLQADDLLDDELGDQLGTETAAVSNGGLVWNGFVWEDLTWNSFSSGGLVWNGLVWNGASLAGLLGGRSVLEAFVSEPLEENMITTMLATDPTGNGASVLEYSVVCAVPAGGYVTVAGRQFDGILGLVTGIDEKNLKADWPKAALNQQGIRWWFACMLALVNPVAHVQVSLRARHPNINKPDAGFDYFEGAFWGEPSKKASVGEHDILIEQGYACYGLDQLQACGGDSYLATWKLWQRFCARNAHPDCNMKVVGQCLDYDGSGQYACGADDTINVADCHVKASTSKNEWNGAESFGDAVISAYLPKIDCEIDPDFPMP